MSADPASALRFACNCGELGGEITAKKIADFLILNRQSPRSLITATTLAMDHLDHLAQAYDKSGPAQMRARALVAELGETRVEEIFDEGLHEFLTRFIRDVGELANLVFAAYLSGEAR